MNTDRWVKALTVCIYVYVMLSILKRNQPHTSKQCVLTTEPIHAKCIFRENGTKFGFWILFKQLNNQKNAQGIITNQCTQVMNIYFPGQCFWILCFCSVADLEEDSTLQTFSFRWSIILEVWFQQAYVGGFWAVGVCESTIVNSKVLKLFSVLFPNTNLPQALFITTCTRWMRLQWCLTTIGTHAAWSQQHQITSRPNSSSCRF